MCLKLLGHVDVGVFGTGLKGFGFTFGPQLLSLCMAFRRKRGLVSSSPVCVKWTSGDLKQDDILGPRG